MQTPSSARPQSPDTGLDTPRRVRAIVAGTAGNLVEWYDWYAYATFSLYFAPRFFPASDRTAQLMSAAAVFAVGFLMRPIGGWVMGAYADRRGRARALSLSVLLMCGGSLLIGLTPGYETIGLGAPVLLVLARLLQGFSVGGEYATSATYLSEIATSSQRGFYASFQYVTLVLGQLLAQAVLIVLQRLVLTPDQLSDWGWRIPFVIGAALAAVVRLMRRGMIETEAFARTSGGQERAGELGRLLTHRREVGVVVGMTLGGTVAFYTFTTYMQKFLVNTAALSPEVSSVVSASTLFAFMLVQPLVGAISDRVGRRPVLIAFGVLGTLFTVPILQQVSRATSGWEAAVLVLLGLLIVSGYTSINAVVKAELFPAEIRALGVGLPYALTVSVFGGTAELVALWLKSRGIESAFYWYVTACIACSLAVCARMRETRVGGAL